MAKINVDVDLGPEDEGKSLTIEMSSKQSPVVNPKSPKKKDISPNWLAIVPLVKILISKLSGKYD